MNNSGRRKRVYPPTGLTATWFSSWTKKVIPSNWLDSYLFFLLDEKGYDFKAFVLLWTKSDIPALSKGVKRPGYVTHLHLILGLRISRAMLLLSCMPLWFAKLSGVK